MKSYCLVFLFLVALSQGNLGDQSKGKLKPEVGTADCELSSGDPKMIWGAVYDHDCKLDGEGRTIKEPARYSQRRKGLFDPCCTDYLGLVCRQVLWAKKGDGLCVKPDPYRQNSDCRRDDFLYLMKRKKMADGQQLDGHWKYVEEKPFCSTTASDE